MSERRRWAALVVLCTGQLMIVLDGTVVNVALPVIQRDLHFTGASLAWVVNAYLLTFGGCLLLAGRLGDLFGQKRIFLVGMALFTVSSAACGFSDSPDLLVAARFAQGLGAASAGSMVLGILVNTFPKPAERTRAMSVYALVANVGGAIGLLVGGTITELLSWHWIFFLNVPIGIVGCVLGGILIGDEPGLGATAGADVLGAFLVAGVPTVAIYAIVGGSTAGWLSLQTIGLFVLVVAGGAAFVFRERRVSVPLMPFRIFRSPKIRISILVRLCFGMGMSTFFYIGSLFFEDVLHYSSFETGVGYFPSNLVVGVGSVVLIGRLIRRFGASNLIVPGAVAVAIALFLWGIASPSGSYVEVVLPGMILAGVGASLVFMPSVTLAMSDVRPEESGVASGVTNVTVQLGSALGVAIAASVESAVTGAALRSGEGHFDALVDGLHAGFFFGSGVLVLAAVWASILLRTARREAPALTTTSGAALLLDDAELSVVDPT